MGISKGVENYTQEWKIANTIAATLAAGKFPGWTLLLAREGGEAAMPCTQEAEALGQGE